jgi:hypothetical protein
VFIISIIIMADQAADHESLNQASASSAAIDYDKLLLLPVFPLSGEVELDFDTLDCVPLGEVNIIDDDSRITFYVQSNYRYLVCYLHACGRFVSMTLTLLDSKGREINLELSNRRSNVLIDKNNVKLPLNVGLGWQRMCIDLEDIMARCFGTSFASCSEICIAGGPRLAKLFFQGDSYCDPQLPPYLRVLAI